MSARLTRVAHSRLLDFQLPAAWLQVKPSRALLVPAEALVAHFEAEREAELKARFLRMSVFRYVSIPAVVFSCYMIPKLSMIYLG